MFATVRDIVKIFDCGGLFSFLYFNFLHDPIHYLCANCEKFCVKKFASGGLSALLNFNLDNFLQSSDLFLPTPLLETALYAYTIPSGGVIIIIITVSFRAIF